jgi:hypothetical protein
VLGSPNVCTPAFPAPILSSILIKPTFWTTNNGLKQFKMAVSMVDFKMQAK